MSATSSPGTASTTISAPVTDSAGVVARAPLPVRATSSRTLSRSGSREPYTIVWPRAANSGPSAPATSPVPTMAIASANATGAASESRHTASSFRFLVIVILLSS